MTFSFIGVLNCCWIISIVPTLQHCIIHCVAFYAVSIFYFLFFIFLVSLVSLVFIVIVFYFLATLTLKRWNKKQLWLTPPATCSLAQHKSFELPLPKDGQHRGVIKYDKRETSACAWTDVSVSVPSELHRFLWFLFHSLLLKISRGFFFSIIKNLIHYFHGQYFLPAKLVHCKCALRNYPFAMG